MSHTVNQFPIFHHYLTAILLKTGLAEGSYTHIFNTVSKYEVLDFCRCGDPCCSTVYLHSPTLLGKDGAFCNAFNKGWVIINFYPDGKMEIENLADNEGCNFPFKHEILAVFAGKELEYDSADAEKIVEEFMSKFKRQEVQRIEV